MLAILISRHRGGHAALTLAGRDAVTFRKGDALSERVAASMLLASVPLKPWPGVTMAPSGWVLSLRLRR
jgi:hypothetical protein